MQLQPSVHNPSPFLNPTGDMTTMPMMAQHAKENHRKLLENKLPLPRCLSSSTQIASSKASAHGEQRSDLTGGVESLARHMPLSVGTEHSQGPEPFILEPQLTSALGTEDHRAHNLLTEHF